MAGSIALVRSTYTLAATPTIRPECFTRPTVARCPVMLLFSPTLFRFSFASPFLSSHIFSIYVDDRTPFSLLASNAWKFAFVRFWFLQGLLLTEGDFLLYTLHTHTYT